MIFLDWLWRSSWQAAVFVAVVLVIRACCGRALRPRWRLALWALVLVRLALPVLPSSRFSLFGAADWIGAALRNRSSRVVATPVAASGATVEVHYGGIDGLAASRDDGAAPERAAAASAPAWHGAETILLVWLIGAAALLARLVAANVGFIHRVRRGSVVADDRLLQSLDAARVEMHMSRSPQLLVTDVVDAPAVAGLFRPRILLPPALANALSARQLRLVFLHELAHVKCRDIAMDWVWAMAVVVHWFNPALWFARSRYRADRELARDAMVLSTTGVAEAEGYGRTILQLVQVARPLRLCPGLVGIADGRTELRRRIAMIARFDMRRRPFSWLGMLLFAIVGCAALTDSRGQDKPMPPPARTSESTIDSAPAAAPAPALAPPALDPDDAAAQARLDRRLPEVNFAAVPFSDVIDFLRDITQSNIFVNWKALEAAGIDRGAAVTARLRDVKFSKALRTILDDLGGGTVKLGFAIDDGVVTITTQEDLDRNVVTRVYDVRDLIVTVPDFDPLPGALGSPDTPVPTTKPSTRPASAIDALVAIIQESVAFDSWREKGGHIGSIRELSGQLVITQTSVNQQAIAKLLDELRTNRAVQITVETRFLLLGAEHLAKLSPALRERFAAASRAPNDDAGARVERLDKQEVAEVLRATQNVVGATVISAPRLTLFSGQRGSVVVTRQHDYVASVRVSKGADGATSYAPEVKTFTTGISLDMRATASADRKSVNLSFHPKLSDLERIDTAPAPGTPPEANAVVQKPVINVREMNATTTIPDGTTLLTCSFEESTGVLGEAPVPSVPKARAGARCYVLIRPKLILNAESGPSTAPADSSPR